MQVYLAALETGEYVFDNMPNDYIKFGLVSFFYLKDDEQFEKIKSKCQKIVIDSGAHSFQHGKKVDFDAYTEKYIRFIKKYQDDPKVTGFFEMDIDNITGYETVKRLQDKLTAVSDKIIPVWHNNRGIDDFYDMCERFKGRRISITGFSNNDITDEQYNLFINTAHKIGVNVHILGMTRFNLIKNLNLHKNDSFDSSSWKQTGIFGGASLITKDDGIIKFSATEGLKVSYKPLITQNLITLVKTQDIYENKDNSIYFKGGDS